MSSPLGVLSKFSRRLQIGELALRNVYWLALLALTIAIVGISARLLMAPPAKHRRAKLGIVPAQIVPRQLRMR